ncbi:AraC family transcriptional regulator [Sciscionella sediminilitoris]|uniref:AraC family transcriptional regulator n=1 Tax=Sciscionella sediminilitoris TaxID=1445613 RepID=UPI0012E20C9E|nr:AraC family transcriptional regulator [Sciscionella sp. SE31]
MTCPRSVSGFPAARSQVRCTGLTAPLADAVGYARTGTFISMFSGALGVSPSEYY